MDIIVVVLCVVMYLLMAVGIFTVKGEPESTLIAWQCMLWPFYGIYWFIKEVLVDLGGTLKTLFKQLIGG